MITLPCGDFDNPPNTEITILVVDDVRAIRNIMASYLKTSGYRVVTAENGWEAWKKIRDGLRPALILTDIEMPDWNGAQLIRKIKESATPAINEIPILVCSSINDPKLRREIALAGVEGFQTKPVNLPVLLGLIEYLI